MKKLFALFATAGLLVGCGDSTGPGSGQTFRNCAEVGSMSVGGDLSGSLTTADCVLQPVVIFGIPFGGSYVDYHEFSISSGQSVVITMSSTEFDTVLLLFNRASGDLVDFDDDDGEGGVGTNSRLEMTLPAGTYVIGATSFDEGETGTYQLAVN